MNVTRSNQRKWFHIKKVKKQAISCETDTDYKDLVLLTNTQAQAKFLLHSLKQAARDIILYMNTNKIEFTRFK